MSIYPQDRFLACRDCAVVHPVAQPSHAWPDEAMDVAFEAYGEFICAHLTHHIDELRRSGSEAQADRPLWDPMAVISFEATDGIESYVVTSSRESIDGPRIYRFGLGRLAVKSSAVDIDDDDLRRALDREFYPQALRPTKLDRFVCALREVVSHVNPAELAIAFDTADDPATSIARMPDATYQELVTRCAEIFDAAELQRVSEFLRDNRNEDGLLALRVHRQLAVVTA
jgi:hypothetical protein